MASLREDDNQLYEAFTLLKGINVYKSIDAKRLQDASSEQAEPTDATKNGRPSESSE